jgi:hypothetical protein
MLWLCTPIWWGLGEDARAVYIGAATAAWPRRIIHLSNALYHVVVDAGTFFLFYLLLLPSCFHGVSGGRGA